MSYNIFNKNASFQGTAKGSTGSIEYLVDTHSDVSIGGTKTVTGPLTSSTGLDFGSGLLSGSGKVSASFFYGDATHLTNAGTITSYSNHATDRLIAGGASSTAIKGLSTVTFSSGKLSVTGQISASLGVSGTTLHGAGGAITGIDADNISAGSLSAARLDLGSAGGLEANSDSLRINLSGSASGLSLSGDGITLDVAALVSDGTYGDTKTIIVQDGTGDPKKQPLTVLEANMTIAGGNITGTGVIPNAALPTNISVASVTASTWISASAFHGDGAALTNISSTPAPAGSNTQIQFNADGVVAADADFTFLTGSNTLATSNLSASVNISGSSLYLQDEIIVGGNTFLNSEGNIAIVNEITASGDISSSLDIHALNFRGNGSTLNNVPLGSSNAASIVFVDNETNKTITTNSGFTFNGTHAVNTGGGFKGTTLSASADVQVGGHITGSGDIVLLGAANSIIFDKPAGDGPLITTAGSNEMTIDGDNTVKIQSDSFVVIRQNTTAKHTYNFSSNYITSSMNLSSSAAVSASMVDSETGYKVGGQTFINADANMTVGTIGGTSFSGSSFVSASIVDSLTGYKLGDQTVMDANANMTVGTIGAISFSGSSFVSASIVDSLTGYKIGNQSIVDSNANLTVGLIGSQNITIVYDDDESPNALDFGAGAVSGSGYVSASAFVGDGSQLTNLSGPTHRYHYITAVPKLNTNEVSSNTFQIIGKDGDGIIQSSDPSTHFTAPASGSIVRVIYTPSYYNTNGSGANVITTSHTPQFYMRKNDIKEGAPISGIALHMTASAANMKPTNVVNNAGTLNGQTVIFDIENNNPVISGSATFNPGDIMVFSGKNTATLLDCGVTIVLKLTEEGVSYP